MSEGRSAYARAVDDWYVEPPWVSERLLDAERFDGAHDPACGAGTFPGVLELRGLPFTGPDIVDRAQGKFALRDFLIPIPSPAWPNIVCNPPASKLIPFVEQALTQVEPGGLVAVLATLKWAASQGRYALFSRPEMERVVILSRRPSIPPGELLKAEGKAIRKGGSIDFAWYLWRVGKAHAGTRVGWLK